MVDSDAEMLCFEMLRLARADPETASQMADRGDALAHLLRKHTGSSPEFQAELENAISLLLDWGTPGGWEKHGATPQSLQSELMAATGRLISELGRAPPSKGTPFT